MDGLLVTERGLSCVSVLLAGRPTLLRHGLSGILKRHQPNWTITEADSFGVVTELLGNEKPDLLLLDAQLPGADGLDGVRRVKALAPGTKLLVLGDTDHRATVLDFIDAGASGYLTTSADTFQVLCAFNAVLAGGVFAPASLTQAPAPSPLDALSAGGTLVGLTDRQREVFGLMAQGYATKTIARQLGLAVGTVKVHLAAIYRSIGAHSRTEAVAKIRLGAVGGTGAAQSAN